MIEVELKAALNSQQVLGLPERLVQLGFTAQARLHEVDVYYNGNDRDFHQTDEALRLRAGNNLDTNATHTLLTYKSSKQDARSSTRLEHETVVGDAGAMQSILAALGYQAAFTVDKTRGTYTRGAITVCIDAVVGLGSFIELECVTDEQSSHDEVVDELLLLLDSLRVSRHALTRRSYLELLITAATL